MDLKFTHNNNETSLTILARKPEIKVEIDDVIYGVQNNAREDGRGVLTLNGKQYPYYAIRSGNHVYLRMAHRNWAISLLDPRDVANVSDDFSDNILAPMPGMIVNVLKSAGDEVKHGEPVLTIESMKLQMNLDAPRDGVIEAFHKNEGETFDKDEVIVSLMKDDVTGEES